MIVQGIAAAVTVFGIAMAALQPGRNFMERLGKSKEESAKALDEALTYASQYEKTKAHIRKVPVKPGAGHAAYFQINTSQGLHYFVIFSNGDISSKSEVATEWTFHRGPSELNESTLR